MRLKEDLIPIVEAAYDLEGTTESWLRGIAQAARPAFDEGWGILAYTYDATDNAWIKVECGGGAEFSEIALSVLFNPPPAPEEERQALVQAYRRHSVASARRLYRDWPSLLAFHTEATSKIGCGDILGINGVDPSARGTLLTVPLKRIPKMAPRTIYQRSCLAAHLAAGHRARLQLASLCGQPLECSPGTEAVFEPGGKLQHAVGRATERTVRQHLHDTVLAIERARTVRVRRSDPAGALEIWQGLIAGRWSLLEQFDSDGRRYLIVPRNDPATPDPCGLTLRECQVLAYALIGHSNKLTGYELGLNESTVAYHVKHLCKKLGVSSRVELVQRYSHLVPTPTVAPLQSKS